jgi:hypothetical protein
VASETYIHEQDLLVKSKQTTLGDAHIPTAIRRLTPVDRSLIYQDLLEKIYQR